MCSSSLLRRAARNSCTLFLSDSTVYAPQNQRRRAPPGSRRYLRCLLWGHRRVTFTLRGHPTPLPTTVKRAIPIFTVPVLGERIFIHIFLNMPLVVLVGRPSSGKTTVACQIEAVVRQLDPERKIDVLDDSSTMSANQTKSDCYRDSRHEKMTLGALRSSVERRLSKSTVLLFDSLNMIKGYRYEIWALARQVGTRCCVVSVETSADTCKAWNAARLPKERYEEEVMDDLVGRLERPDSIRRWESPLFSIYPERESREEITRVCEAVAAYCIAMDGNPQQQKKTVAVTGRAVGDLKQTIATSRNILAPTNLLHDVDKEVQMIVKQIVDAQTLAGGAPAGIVTFGPDMPVLNLTRQVSTVELRRWKRLFVKMVTNTTFSERRPTQVQSLFVQFVVDQIHSS